MFCIKSTTKKKEESVAKAKAKSHSKGKSKAKTSKTSVKKNSKSKVAKAAPKKSVAAKKTIGKKETKSSRRSLAVVKAVHPPVKAKNWADILTPLDDRVLVKPALNEKVTAGGIIIPDTAAATGNFRGEVLVVGRGHRDSKGRLRPMDVKAGDMILFEEFSGSKIEIMGEDLRLLRETEILGIWE